MKTNTYSYGTTPYNVITSACKQFCPNGFKMLIRNPLEWKIIANAVNQGIDSYLEGFTRSTFNSDNGECLIHPEELHILLRRLNETDSDDALSLRTDILSTLEIEEI